IAPMPHNMAAIEVAREAATIIMLYVAGRLGAETAWQQFAGFMFLFGVWDIFYYVWLRVLIGWPQSLGTWDILFLIPVPGIGPGWSPVVISLSLIAGALAVESIALRGRSVRVTGFEKLALGLSGLIVILSFTLDWKFAVNGGTPDSFRAPVFWVGEALGL